MYLDIFATASDQRASRCASTHSTSAVAPGSLRKFNIGHKPPDGATMRSTLPVAGEEPGADSRTEGVDGNRQLSDLFLRSLVRLR